MQLLKKMSSRSMFGNVKKISLSNFYQTDGELKPDAPDRVDLYTLIGVADGFKTGSGDYGDWVSFEGQFKAISNIPDESGELEEYRSAKCFLPEPAQSMLIDALGDNDSVELGFVIGIKPCSTPIGYEFVCTPLVKPAENDALAALEARLTDSMPKLAAPAKKAGKK